MHHRGRVVTMTTATRYATLKARGVCPAHPDRASVPHQVYCAECAADNRAYQRNRYEATLTVQQRLTWLVYAQRPALPTIPDGPLIACCGEWRPIREVPWRCPTCGTAYFQEG